MQEDLLQFIWQHNLYRPGALRTTDGAPVQVIHPGTINRDAGPDFSLARIRMGTALIIGHAELHIRTSDWWRHHHDTDPAYDKVVLHIVYEHDTKELPGNIPVLPLKEHIPDGVPERYRGLVQTLAPLPCAAHLGQVPPIVRSHWQGRMLVERWEKKMTEWERTLAEADGDWNALLYRQLAANFGFKVNATPFSQLAASLPPRIPARQQSLFTVEALVFGQAGLLKGDYADDYPVRLKEEYGFLRKKYGLDPIDPSLWKFLRLRPANFPTIRLAQFAALLHRSPQLFQAIAAPADVSTITAALSVTAGTYWDTHYHWDEPPLRASVKSLGTDAICNIIINTVAPFRFLYARAHGKGADAEAAMGLLDGLPPEDNRIIRMWQGHGWAPDSAGGSQGLLQLFNQYCSRKRCLECAIGLRVIRSGPDK